MRRSRLLPLLKSGRAPLLAGLAGVIALSACGTPQEQCIARNTRENRVLLNLLEEVEGNLARGYAWEKRQVTSTEWDTCTAVVRVRRGKNKGERELISRPCLRDVTETERFRVPIDPAAEVRKRNGLRERLAALAPQADAALRACRAAYPE